MTRGLPASGSEAAANELLAQLGLPASASPEDVDNLHQAASQYLASAPPELRGWAHAQASALDQAYLQLTDPVGLQGSALRSPARPPAVVPGGPATPPVRRGPVPAEPPIPAAAAGALVADTATEPDLEATADEADLDDLAVLYASVTPSAHPDMIPGAKPKAQAPAPARRPVTAPAAATAVTPQAANPWKWLVIGGVAVFAIIGIGFGAVQVAGSVAGGSPASSPVAQAQPSAPAVDVAKISTLMEKLAANPKDTETLLALANEYYGGGQYADAGNWLDKLLAIEPENVKALLARGAVSFNTSDLLGAETTWKKVVVIDPGNQEVHYDLGFLYMNQKIPDWAAVQREWNKVIAIDPTSQIAQTVKSHMDALVKASMIPGPSSSDAPGASPAASAGTSNAPSPAPSASPAAGSPAPSGAVLDQKAVNLAFTNAAMAAPAGSAFTIHFDNQDTEISHNIEITDASGARAYFGTPITGQATTDYEVPALTAGSYTFKCTIHPTMTGTLKIGS